MCETAKPPILVSFWTILTCYKKAEEAAAEAKERERGSAKTALPGKSTKRIMAMD